MAYDWSFQEFMGYLNTWSAVKHYEAIHRKSPLALVEESLQELWSRDKKIKVKFPLILKLGVNS
ncbi:hypothetical protein KZP23_20750 [Echinicola marina]|uniref:hypothetical protein n=1 Tax=Echinicola marina TaxID=2859768 RepID=UPI001CF6FEBB|nr:hypothetical protein [Echinicola marina]UCS93062.1 hypothetical protein KZP23_20750 [Echinicola marina]